MKLEKFFSLLAVGIVASCTVSDASGPAPAAAPQAAASSAGSVQISGIANFRQTAVVLTDTCSTAKYETDRQAFARAAIDNALESYAATLPGGLSVNVQSLSLRMRCHAAGAGSLQSYCAAQATLALAATGKDRNGQEIKVTTSKDVTERAQQGLLCISTMPAVTAAVDKALAEALVDIQGGLTARTGIPAR
jgi:hypothetical protein